MQTGLLLLSAKLRNPDIGVSTRDSKLPVYRQMKCLMVHNLNFLKVLVFFSTIFLLALKDVFIAKPPNKQNLH